MANSLGKRCLLGMCNRTMKTVLVAGLILSLVLAGCTSTARPTATPQAREDYSPVISVTGEVVPARWATLSHKKGGMVAEVRVEPGDPVAVGAVLLRMDSGELEIALQVARQDVAVAQAALDRLFHGASEQVIARADRDHAQQMAQAEIALAVKQQQVAQAQLQDPAMDVAVARARVRQLEAQLVQARAQDPAPAVTVAQVELERAKIALDDVQNEYNKALDRPWENQSVRDAWAKQLQQAQLNYRSAQAQLERARSTQRAHVLGLDVLAAQLEEANALLAQALNAQKVYDIRLNTLDAEVRAAQLNLRYLRAWDNPYRDRAIEPEIAQARARVDQAELSVAQIERQIAETQVRAPFDGTVGAVRVRAGELVIAGQPLVTLGDLSRLWIETTDLDEIDVVRVAIDRPASITLDALPDRILVGRVSRISPMAESETGAVHYTAVVELTESDAALRWGMTAFVDIETQ